MGEPDKLARFERTVLEHSGAAYNLARWLTRRAEDAEDLVQEAYLRAFAAFDGFRGGDGRAWLLAIVRNTCYTWLKRNRAQDLSMEFDERLHSPASADASPEALQLRQGDAKSLQEALEKLPADFREALVLREMEELSYKEIAEITGVALGTVMSRLSRARQRLLELLREPAKQGA